ncbi:(2Fe-2S)-binding protein [Cupriavidus sp. D39]|uniref:(2Fe-2S)-binding protein n=1 Tax=Cupriavidus sp. D39 TaxID=2997877 RepID=UPI00226E5CF1|nr:(2Fe-2S)-binding protein [Cupriavidus sp. D39]MCY0853468.1 (2Fe-2S)-binding protein [Cupriavidus sp. D39]
MKLQINDKTYEVQADAETPLLWVIRDELGLTGTKYGCGLAQCGACSVLVDGVVVRSCVTPVEGMAGRRITTIEAIEKDDVGKRVVGAWVKHQVPQCGYCQSGQVMAATALLKQVQHPTDEQIAAAMVNLCRCGTYNAISAAVHDLAGDGTGRTAAAVLPEHAPQHGKGKVAAAVAIGLTGIGALGVMHKRKSEKADDEGDGV